METNKQMIRRTAGPRFTFKLSGEKGLFTNPMTKIGGQKSTYPIPTASALIGIMQNIYWKPPIRYIPDRIKVLNPILTQSESVKVRKQSNDSCDLAFYTYLKNPSYLVQGHIEFNYHVDKEAADFNMGKHMGSIEKAIKKGGHRRISIGVSECYGYVEPAEWDSEKSFYDQGFECSTEFGLMVHSELYPEISGREEIRKRMWSPKMVNGVIEFCHPDDCPVDIFVRKAKIQKGFHLEKNR